MSGDGWDEAMHAHEAERDRARFFLSKGRNPSLESQRDYYEQKAGDDTLPPPERHLWQRLADELTHRLNDRGEPAQDQSALF